jgi:2-aminoadipate transaminase
MSASALFDRLLDDDRWSSSVIRDLLIHARRPDVISLAGGLPAQEVIPRERCMVAADRILTERGAVALQYGVSAGESELRELLVRSSEPEPDRIVVTAGSQQALDLVARLVGGSTGTGPLVAAIEDPGYLGAIQVLRSHRYELAGIPVDADGLVVDVLAERIAAGLRPRLCYVNPTFQNPTGATLSAERAHQLVELAEANDFWIVADDPYAELGLEGHPPPGLPRSANVIRLGSTSKVVAPGLRIGWIDADPRIADRVVLVKQTADLHTSTFNQLVVAEILGDEIWWERHLDALRARYLVRRTHLADALAQRLPGLAVTTQSGGFFLWGELANPVPDLVSNALQRGVAVVPGSAFAVESSSPNTMRLSYSAGAPEHFDEAVRRLAEAIAAG